MALCEKDIEGLLRLKDKTDQFIQDVFDWVAPLNEHSIIGRLYDFQRVIKAKITYLEKESER